MKRFLIILVLVGVFGAGAWIYFSFFANSPSVVVAPPGQTSFPEAGPSSAPGGTETNTGTPSEPAAPTVATARLVRVSAGPIVPGIVATYNAGNASTSPETTVSYIERRSGNVYRYRSSAKTTTRTSNRTVPGIQSAQWLPNASLAFVRYLSGTDFSTINTFGLPADGSEGFFLPQNISAVSVSSTSLLTLTSGVNGSSALVSRTDGTRSTAAFTTPLSSLSASFAGKSYLATTKASATLPGSAYLVDSAGRFTKVRGPLSGLSALASPSGAWVLVSYVTGSTIHLELVDTTTNEVVSLPLSTLVEKCSWASDSSAVYCGVPLDPPTALYPDDWYQGAVHFSDRLWKIQVSGRYAQLVLDFNKEADEALDAISLTVDPGQHSLSFINKNDGSLWTYSL